jgi:hypothetical protein
MSYRDLYSPKKSKFIEDDEVDQIISDMERDDLLNTNPVYVKDADESICLVTFREKHEAYIKTHPKVDPRTYLANVKTMIRIRSS